MSTNPTGSGGNQIPAEPTQQIKALAHWGNMGGWTSSHIIILIGFFLFTIILFFSESFITSSFSLFVIGFGVISLFIRWLTVKARSENLLATASTTQDIDPLLAPELGSETNQPTHTPGLEVVWAWWILASALIGIVTISVNAWAGRFPDKFNFGKTYEVGFSTNTLWILNIISCVILSLVFTTRVGAITKGADTDRLAFRYLLNIKAGAALCWVIGGLVGLGMNYLTAEYDIERDRFRDQRLLATPPLGINPRMAQGWIVWSTIFQLLGELFLVVLGLIILKAKFKPTQMNANPATTIDLAFVISKPVRPLALIALAATGILASALLHGVFEGSIAPHLKEFRSGRLVGFTEGFQVGLVFGYFLSLFFTAGAGIITNAACTYKFAVRYLLGVMGGAGIGSIIGWFVGEFVLGFIGLTLGWLGSTYLGLGLLRAHWLRNQPQANPATMPEPLPNGNAAPSS